MPQETATPKENTRARLYESHRTNDDVDDRLTFPYSGVK